MRKLIDLIRKDPEQLLPIGAGLIMLAALLWVLTSMLLASRPDTNLYTAEKALNILCQRKFPEAQIYKVHRLYASTYVGYCGIKEQITPDAVNYQLETEESVDLSLK